MMARYIDCDECYHGRVCAHRHHYHDMIVTCNHYIPTTDVAEVKHGYWKGKPIAGYSNIKCSVCNTRFVQETGTWSYCPECGAKMNGGKEE